jgi:hypothetical protein
MVNDQGQLYTIEGVAAAVLMVFTAYVTLSATTLYTPGDTHVIDMQLEQLGNDVLAMMDTADSYNSDTTGYEMKQSDLERFVMESDSVGFRYQFSQYINYLQDGPDIERPIDFNAKVYYRDDAGTIKDYVFTNSTHMTDTEHFIAANPVTVTRWVYLNGLVDNTIDIHPDNMRNAPQTVLFEVTLWRD